MHTIRLSGAITHHVETKFTFGRFGTHEHFAFGWTITLGIELEVVDQRFHTACELPLGRRRYFRIAHAVRARGHSLQRLVDNPETLLHFQHTHEITIIH